MTQGSSALAKPPIALACIVADERGVLAADSSSAAEAWMIDIDSMDPLACHSYELYLLSLRAPDESGHGWMIGVVYARLWLSLVSDGVEDQEFSPGRPLRMLYDSAVEKLRLQDADLMGMLDHSDPLLMSRQELVEVFERAETYLGRGYVSGIIATRSAMSIITGAPF